MQQTLELVERLIASQSTFKDRVKLLANSAGIDTRSRGGITCDILSLRDVFKEMSCAKFVVIMLTCMVRSYTGHDDTGIVPNLEMCYSEYFNTMTVAERMFYLLLKFRLGEAQLEKPPWDEEDVPIWVALAAKVDEPEVDDEIPRF